MVRVGHEDVPLTLPSPLLRWSEGNTALWGLDYFRIRI